MLSPEEISELAARIVGGHEEAMVAELLEQLMTSLASGGVLTNRDQRLLESTAMMNRDAVNQILAKYNRRIAKESKDLVAEALLKSDTGDVEILSSVYGVGAGAGTSAAFTRIAEETAEGVAKIIARNNLKLAYRAQQVWYDVAGEAIVNWNHGSISADRIIGRAVRRLSSEGLTTIDYASGVKSNIDVAVRRHIVTQTSQASGRMTMQRMQQYGHDLVFTSAHFGARPDHVTWQGKVFSLSGSGKYLRFDIATGYGTVTGLQGVNCGHTYGPYFEGITTLPELPGKVHGKNNDQMYEATQKQRAFERSIRETKREINGLNQTGTDDTLARLKLGNQQARLKAYVDKNRLPRQPLREKAYGVGDQPRALRKPRTPVPPPSTAAASRSGGYYRDAKGRALGASDVNIAQGAAISRESMRLARGEITKAQYRKAVDKIMGL